MDERQPRVSLDLPSGVWETLTREQQELVRIAASLAGTQRAYEILGWKKGLELKGLPEDSPSEK